MMHTPDAPPWRLPLVARNHDEQHRASTSNTLNE